MAPFISCIVLAAGESVRMGVPKLLLPIGEKTMLKTTIDNFLASKADEIIVVLGDRASEYAALIAKLPLKIAYNPDYRQGMSTSIIAGLGALDERSQGIMIALADQPFVNTETINQLIEAFAAHDKGIVVPLYRRKRGNPVIFDAKYKDELLRLRGDIGGRGILKQHQHDILEIEVGCEGILLDIDTPNEYNKMAFTSAEKGR